MKQYTVLLLLGFCTFSPFTGFTQEPKLMLPIGHSLGVATAVFSPDGKRIVTSSLDNTVKIWEVSTGLLLANLLGHTDTVVTASFSPNGKLILTAGEDGTAKLWDANSTILKADIKADDGTIRIASFSPDGKKILTVAENGSFKLWEVATGKLLVNFKGHAKLILEAWFSENGKKIATASIDSTAKIWDAETGKLLIDLKDHKNEVHSISLSADGKKVITGSADSTAKVWDAETGKILFDLKKDKGSEDYTIFSPDGKNILTVSDNGFAKIWDAETGILLHEFEGDRKGKKFYPDVVVAAFFSPDGKKFFTSTLECSVKIWDVVTGKLLTEIKDKNDYLNSACFSPDGKMFALALASANVEIYDMTKGNLLADIKGEVSFLNGFTYSSDGKRILVSSRPGSAKLFDAETGRLITLFSAIPSTFDSKKEVQAVFSPDGKKVLTNAFNRLPWKPENYIRVWDAVSGAHIRDLEGHAYLYFPGLSTEFKKIVTLSGDSVCKIWSSENGKLLFDIKQPESQIGAFKISNNGKRLLTFNYKDTVYNIWDLETGEHISKITGIEKNIYNPEWSPSGDRILASSFDSIAHVWDANTGSVLLNIREPDNPIRFVQYSPDGKKLIIQVGTGKKSRRTTKILDAETGELIHDLKSAEIYWAYLFSRDGEKITYSNSDGSLKTWDFEKKELIAEYKGHMAEVVRIRYSTDQKKIVTASNDGTAKVWDVNTRKLLLDLKGHNFRVNNAQFSLDGKKIITVSMDQTAKVWDAETGQLLYTFISLNDDYLVLDKFDHFDGTEGARKLLYFTCGTEVIELDQVKDQLWVPNLAERILKGETINAAKLSDLNICNLTPIVDTLEQSSSQYRFRITPRLGGLGVTIVYVNGIEVTRYTPQQLQQLKGEYQLSIDKKDLQKFFVSNKENTISVKALSAKTSISSRSVSINEKGIEKNNTPPNLFAVVVGVSDYKGDDLDLKFAAKDAVDMANAIDASAKKLLNTDGKDHVYVYRVNTGAGRDRFPEKNSIRQLFTEISIKAQPNDILMIFFAGHGVVESLPAGQAGEKNQFYFLTADASGATVSGALKDVGISTEELSDWIKPQVMKAQKRILIFDACNSGQAIKEIVSINQDGKNMLAARGDDNGKRIKAIEKLNEKSGMFILSASASDQNAYELGKYNQGALTYSLLKAIKEQPEILEDRQYLNVSRWFDAAEKTVNELSRETGARQQPQLVSTSNFNIGVVDDDVRNKIILPFEKSLFTRSDFRNADLRIDNLKLRTLVDKRLEEISDNKQDGLLLFSPEFDGTNIYAISGDYTVAGNTITLSLILTKGGTEIKAKFELVEALANLDALPGRITSFVMDWLKNPK